MTRSTAREIALHLVFEMNFKGVSADEALETLMNEEYYPTLKSETDIYEEKPDRKQMDYLCAVTRGVAEQKELLDGYIKKYSIGWSLDRISRVARAIMQIAMYESLYVEDVPVSAAINEAVELTRKYEDEDVVSFVNGILGGFARENEEQEHGSGI